MEWFHPVPNGQRPVTVSVLSQVDAEAVGSGVLLPRDRFLTCAHVVNCALGKADTTCAERPSAEALKVLVHGPGGAAYPHTARLAVWIPPNPPEPWGAAGPGAGAIEWDGDLAVLGFIGPVPPRPRAPRR